MWKVTFTYETNEHFVKTCHIYATWPFDLRLGAGRQVPGWDPFSIVCQEKFYCVVHHLSYKCIYSQGGVKIQQDYATFWICLSQSYQRLERSFQPPFKGPMHDHSGCEVYCHTSQQNRLDPVICVDILCQSDVKIQHLYCVMVSLLYILQLYKTGGLISKWFGVMVN